MFTIARSEFDAIFRSYAVSEFFAEASVPLLQGKTAALRPILLKNFVFEAEGQPAALG
jgi:hypothetical protein